MVSPDGRPRYTTPLGSPVTDPRLLQPSLSACRLHPWVSIYHRAPSFTARLEMWGH